jgi:hypothetical protein
MFGEVILQGVAREGLRIPADAIIESGTKSIVFVSLGDGKFQPREVETGDRNGSEVEIVSGVSETDAVVSRANFLLDSESRLRASLAALGSGGSNPPAGGHDYDAGRAAGAASEHEDAGAASRHDHAPAPGAASGHDHAPRRAPSPAPGAATGQDHDAGRTAGAARGHNLDAGVERLPAAIEPPRPAPATRTPEHAGHAGHAGH